MQEGGSRSICICLRICVSALVCVMGCLCALCVPVPVVVVVVPACLAYFAVAVTGRLHTGCPHCGNKSSNTGCSSVRIRRT